MALLFRCNPEFFTIHPNHWMHYHFRTLDLFIRKGKNSDSTLENLHRIILTHTLRVTPIPSSQIRPLARISTEAFVLHCMLFASAFALFPMKEVLMYIMVHRGNVRQSHLFLNDFSKLSKQIRAELDTMGEDSVPSGHFAEMPSQASDGIMDLY